MAPGRARAHEALDKVRPAFTGFAFDEPLLRDRGSGGGDDEGVRLDPGHWDWDLGDRGVVIMTVLSHGDGSRYV